MKITVRQPNPHGGRIYPVCDTARLLLELVSSAALKQRKTFTLPELEIIEKLGFEVDVQE